MVRYASLFAGLATLAVLAASPALAEAPVIKATVLKVQVAPTIVAQWSNDRYGPRRRPNAVYMNGYRGSDRWRQGYRRHNDGNWFPAAAFLGSVIIGDAIANGINNGGVSQHVRWCESRYRSYRVEDNSFQPYRGGRVLCASPYGN